MIRSAVVTLGAVIAFTAPALADYYIVQGPGPHCRVVERYNPRDREIVRIGPLSFRDRAEAEREIRVICHESYYPEEPRRVERWEQRYERRD